MGQTDCLGGAETRMNCIARFLQDCRVNADKGRLLFLQVIVLPRFDNPTHPD